MNIYIANLSYNVTDADLKELFEEYGPVSSAKVITDKMSGRSRGFGFVEMDDNVQAQSAIDGLNQCEYDGKVISVNVARPKTEHRGGGGFSNRRPSNDYNSNRRSSRY